MRVAPRIQEQELARTFAEKRTRRLSIETHLAQVPAPLLEPTRRDEIGAGLRLGPQDIASRQEVDAVAELHYVYARIRRRYTCLGIAPEEHQNAVATLGRRRLAGLGEIAWFGAQGTDGRVRLDAHALLAEARQRGLHILSKMAADPHTKRLRHGQLRGVFGRGALARSPETSSG